MAWGSPLLRLSAAVVALAGPALAQTPPATPVAQTATPGHPPPGVAPDLAFAAYQRGYYLTAISEAKKRIDANDRAPAAMTLIGELYKEGLGVNEDAVEAARWFKLGADSGDTEAAFSLAIAYLTGKGVEKSAEKAAPLLEKAAKAGHPAALYQLGLQAMNGYIQDPAKAAGYFQRAMDAGDYDATYALALAYKEGRGVEKDLTKAAAIMKQAADSRLSAAQVDYAIMLFNGEGAPADEAGAAKYFGLAAAADNPVAMNRLARLYAYGRGVKIDKVEAMKWHILARSAGVPDERLDEMLNTLGARDKVAVEDAVRKFAGK